MTCHMCLKETIHLCLCLFFLFAQNKIDAKNYYYSGQVIKIIVGDEYRFDIDIYNSFKINKEKIATINQFGVLKAKKKGVTRLTFKDNNGIYYNLKVLVLPQKKISMQGNFPILAWYSLQEDVSHERFIELNDAGFNLSFSYATDSIVPQMEKAAKSAVNTGIRLILPFRGTWVDVEPIIHKFIDSDVLWGWYIADEPSLEKMSEAKAFIDKIRLYDKKHPFYVNLLPTYADSSLLGGNYLNYVTKYVELINPSFISFDHYPVTYSGIRRDFYKNLRIVSSISRDNNIPFWAFTCSVQYSGSVPPPRLEHLKFEVFTALAFGAQGIQYFTYTTPRKVHGGDHFWNAPIDRTAQKTPTYYWVKEVNSRVRSLEKYFLGAEVKTLGYIGVKDLYGIEKFDIQKLPQCIQSVSCSGTVLISILKNCNSQLLAIVNTSYEESLSFRINSPIGLNKIATDGQKESVSPIEVIPPGEMLLYSF